MSDLEYTQGRFGIKGEMLTFETRDGHEEMELLPLGNGLLSVEVTNPWAGDSDRGFGESGTVNLTVDEVRFLAAWLLNYADRREGK